MLGYGVAYRVASGCLRLKPVGAEASAAARRLLRFGDHLIRSSLRALFFSVIFFWRVVYIFFSLLDRPRAAVVLVDPMFVDLPVGWPSPACFDDEAGSGSHGRMSLATESGIWGNVSHRGKEGSCLTWPSLLKSIERLTLLFFFTRPLRQ